MKHQSWLIAAAVVLAAALINPAESAAQRQRWPGGSGGGRQDSGSAQRDSGGGRQRDQGGSRARSSGGARQQDSGRSQARAAQPRGGDRGDRGRRESAPPVVRQSAPPQSRADADAQDRTRAQRRSSGNVRDGGDRGNVVRDRGDRGGVVRDRVDRGGVVRDRVDRGGVVRDRGNVVRDRGSIQNDSRVRSGSRVAVPRAGRPPVRRDGNYPRGYSVYRNYGGRNIYVIPRGRTYIYYPRYYYTPYSFGYGPAGRGHFYFDLYYNSYVWHPYSVYRYGTYGSYGYPAGELRLKVRPRDAQVFIDGYYAGRVDDFDGIFQSLRLEEGDYQVEIVLPGYEPLAFDVRIFPGEKTTYEGDLIPELP